MNACASATTTRRSERGSALVIVTVIGLLSLGLFGLAWRGTHDAIRVESFERRRAERDESILVALADGVSLLESGRPPSDPFSALMAITGELGDYDCTVTWSSAGDLDTWDVSVAESTEAELLLLDPAPARF